MLRLVLACLSAASAATAQEQMSAEAFLDRAQGRTLTFSQYETGREVGVEQFLRRDLSVWATRTGRCTYGQIEVRGATVCFIYEDFPDPQNCWTPFEVEGDIVVISTRGDVQRVTQITRTPVSCLDAPLS